MLSIVVPAYNEEAMIPEAARAISSVVENEGIDYEIIFVNDGSTDKTWQEILDAHRANSRIRGAAFSRNFGKESAISAGLAEARGDCVAVMDCDLQHPPEKLIEMYHLWQQGYEIIEGVKKSRGRESLAHRLAAGEFYHILSKASGIDMSRASDFKLLDRKAVNVLLNMHEKSAFFRAMSAWVGFKTIQVEFSVQERPAGHSKWNTKKLVRYALTDITSFTTAPMQIVTWLGIILLAFCLVFSVISLVQKIRGSALGGFTTVIIIQAFTSSVLMISMGIIGYYISKIYEEVKGRPRYIIAERTDDSQG